MAKSPAVILFDSNGQAMAVADGVAIAVGTQALLSAGSDGTNAKVLLVDANGRQIFVGAGAAGTPSGGVVTVQGASEGTPLPVSGSFALPTGAATESTLSTRATETTLSALNTKVQTGTIKIDGSATTQPISGTVAVSNFPATQAISASTLPLPTGAATASKQPSLGIAGTPATDVITVQGASSMVALKVDGSATTQPVSGSVSVSNLPATQAVSATTLPLPTGAATSARQDSGNTSLSSIDTKTPALVSGKVPVDVGTPAVSVSNFPATQSVSASTLPLPSGASTAAKQPTLGTAGTASADVLTVQGIAAMTALKVDGSATTQPVSGSVSVSNLPTTQAVSAAALPLPSGASTSAAQTTGNSSLSSIDTKVTGIALDATLTSGAQKAILRGGAKGSTVAADVTSLAAGANHQALAVAIVDGSGNQVTSFGSSTVSVSNFPATQPVSASALPLPTGAATSAAQTTGNSSLSSIDTKVTGLALDATLTGGAQKAILRSGAKGATTAADVTSLAAGANHQALAVAIVDGSGNQITSFGASVDTSALATSAKQPALGTAGTPSADVLTVQGAASMTALKVDGSATTQPTTNLDVATTGAITAISQSVTTPDLNGQGSGVFIIGGTFTGTLQFEGSADGSTYAAAGCRAVNGTNVISSIASGGTWRFNCAGFRNFRIRATSWTSGTANITIRTSLATTGVVLTESLPTGTNQIGVVGQTGTWTVAQGSPAAIANRWQMQLTDGSTQSVIKAASTAAAAIDPALVVAVSPNNTVAVSAASLPLPTGASTAAKQPALGTAGTASTDVLTVQGIASMTALKVDGSGVTQPVSGTVAVSNFPASQAVTVTAGSVNATLVNTAGSMPLATGASTSALQTTGNNSLSNIDGKMPALVSGRLPVDGSAVTQPVSAASLPLPTGAATAVKQPALGTAGTPSTDVITVQGATSMTALKVDGSATTQPVSGTVTANIGTSGSLALDATLTGGSLKSIIRGGAKGSTTSADVTSLATGANHQALVVALVDALGNQLTTFGPPSTDTASVTSVASSTTSVQLLAVNTARVGSTIYNDSTSVLYVKLGTTASSTSFSVKVLANGYYEVPFGYTGRIDGIWLSTIGNARITELS